uniref:V-set and immunoglobulin domain containing 1 n=1 Tax=Catharus ustulatus TaxID=91951 RepID=A0A8C3TUN4_CATUS
LVLHPYSFQIYLCIQMYYVLISAFLGQEARKKVTLSFVIELTNVSLPQIYYYSGGHSYVYGAFKNRITASTIPGNASITISNMQPSDTGSYTCEVFSPQGDSGQSQKSVIVNVLGKCLPSLLLYCLFLPRLSKRLHFSYENQEMGYVIAGLLLVVSLDSALKNHKSISGGRK